MCQYVLFITSTVWSGVCEGIRIDHPFCFYQRVLASSKFKGEEDEEDEEEDEEEEEEEEEETESVKQDF